jgi:hypothetical protein
MDDRDFADMEIENCDRLFGGGTGPDSTDEISGLKMELASLYKRYSERDNSARSELRDNADAYLRDNIIAVSAAYLRGQKDMRDRAAQIADNCHQGASTCGDMIASLTLMVEEAV